MSEDDFESVIKQTVEGNLVTHFLFVVEVMGEDGLDLRVATSDNLTAWTALGMLQVAKDLINEGIKQIEMDDDE